MSAALAVVVPDTRPLELSEETVQQLADGTHFLSAWGEQGSALAKANKHHQFRIGDWILEGEEKLGRKAYREAHVIFTDQPHQTLKQWAHVARRVPACNRIHEGLGWRHYQLVARFAEPELQRELLATAAHCHWKVKAFAEYIKEKHPPVKEREGEPKPTTLSLPAELEKQVKAFAYVTQNPYAATVAFLIETGLRVAQREYEEAEKCAIAA